MYYSPTDFKMFLNYVTDEELIEINMTYTWDSVFNQGILKSIC